MNPLEVLAIPFLRSSNDLPFAQTSEPTFAGLDLIAAPHPSFGVVFHSQSGHSILARGRADAASPHLSPGVGGLPDDRVATRALHQTARIME